MKLSDLLDKYRSVSIIGICKNAGKTTVLNKLIEEFSARGTLLGVTSVGRDGESTDVVTVTPKPEIFVPAGTIVATAKKLLPFCTTTNEILYSTGLPTPLGEIIVFRAKSSGYIQIAGPSITEQLVFVNRLFEKFGAEKILIDGAVSRRSLCSTAVSDATVLCAGASYSPDTDVLAADTAFSAKMLSLPTADYDFPRADKNFSLLYENGKVVKTDENLSGSLKEKPIAMYINGGVTDGIIKPLIRKNIDLDGVTFVADDSSKIFLTEKIYDSLICRGAKLKVKNDVNLVAIAVNPVSAYGYAFDADKLLEKIKALIDLPVFDVEKNYD